MMQGGELGRYTLGQKCDGGEETMLSGGVLGVVAPPLGEEVAEKATKRRDLPLERGEDFPLQKMRLICVATKSFPSPIRLDKPTQSFIIFLWI